MNDALRIKAHCMGRSIAWLYAHPEIEPDSLTAARIGALTARQNDGEPLAYLLESAEFHQVSLKLTPQVLVPRPETELLVELARRETREGGKLLELGTGSGAVTLALAKVRPDLEITATDVSAEALECALQNARALACQLKQPPRFVCADWLAGINSEFDVIVSNPPYVAQDDACLTAPPLRFEPRLALDGGRDGLVALGAIVSAALPRLTPGGMLAVEHGFDQGAHVREMLCVGGYVGVDTVEDLAGHERVSLGLRA